MNCKGFIRSITQILVDLHFCRAKSYARQCCMTVCMTVVYAYNNGRKLGLARVANGNGRFLSSFIYEVGLVDVTATT